MPVARRSLPLAIAALLVGSCGAPPPGPTATIQVTPPGTVRPTESQSAAQPTDPVASVRPTDPAAGAEPPRIVVRSLTPSGVAWSVTEPGAPDRRIPLAVPDVDAELGPATAGGTILMTTRDEVVLAALDGAALMPTTSTPVPSGQALVPACFGGDGRPLLADAETLTLVVLTAAGLRPFTDAPFTLGECAPLGDGRTLVALDGGSLLVDGGDGSPIAISGTLGRHLSSGGRLVAMTDPSTELGAAVVRLGTVSAEGALGAVVGHVVGRGAERVVNAQLSPDGGWLAVVLEQETDAGQEARLRLYRVTADGLTEVSDLAHEVGARITLMPGP